MIEPYQAIGLVPTMRGIRHRDEIRVNIEHISHLIKAASWLSSLDLPVRLIAIPEGSLQGFNDEVLDLDHETIAHSRANSSWSRSRTSSLKPCRAPSGMAMSRTGRSMLDSHDAALIRCDRCSMFTCISSRWRMPRMVGTRPSAWYGSTMTSSLRPAYG